jgi:hypothetical protein
MLRVWAFLTSDQICLERIRYLEVPSTSEGLTERDYSALASVGALSLGYFHPTTDDDQGIAGLSLAQWLYMWDREDELWF